MPMLTAPSTIVSSPLLPADSCCDPAFVSLFFEVLDSFFDYRKHFEAVAANEDEMILADWAYDCYQQKKLHRLFENDDEEINDINEMEKYVMIAIWCIQEDPSLRPTMKKVTLMLEGTVEVSAPPPLS